MMGPGDSGRNLSGSLPSVSPRGISLSLPLSGCREYQEFTSSASVSTITNKPPTRRSPRSASPRPTDTEMSCSRSSSRSPSPRPSSDIGNPDGSPVEDCFLLHGRKYTVEFDNQGISLTRSNSEVCCTPRIAPAPQFEHFPFQEILRAGIADSQHGTCFPVQKNFEYKKMSFLIIHTFRRGKRNLNDWHPLELVLEHLKEEVVARWANAINERIQALTRGSRPRRVQVWINPFGGRKQAVKTWESVCAPIFESAGVKALRTVTKKSGQAREEVEALSLEDLAALDGLAVVGGDGLFGEVLNGVLAIRAGGGPRGAAAARLRLGHIPAGSTDALAWSINGTRNATTAVLRIVLGDRSAVDCQRIDIEGNAPVFSCCMASAGFLGEVTYASELMRWAGPARYDIAGLYAFLKHGTYPVRVKYLRWRDPGGGGSSSSAAAAADGDGADGDDDGAAGSGSGSAVTLHKCGSGCDVCRSALGLNVAETLRGQEGAGDAAWQPPPWTKSSAEALEVNADRVTTLEGKFKGLMCVVGPCRSDKSVNGVSQSIHLADGKILLVMIKECNHAQYLTFLVMLSTTGVIPGKLSFVETIECEAVSIEPMDDTCKWNVDGEPLAHSCMTTQVHRGLVEVFSRGVEQPF